MIDLKYVLSRYKEINPFIRYFSEKNESNNLPYHNWSHSINKMCMSLDIIQNCIPDRVSEEMTYHILIADLFHDFNHSGGEFEDDINIIRAVAALYSEDFKKVLNACAFDFSFSIKLHLIEKLICCTRFPYETHDIGTYEGIMRDSDMRPLLSEDMIQICVLNLSRENKSDLPLKKLIDNQIKFIKSFLHRGFYTPHAYPRYKDKIEGNLNQLIQFSNIF